MSRSLTFRLLRPIFNRLYGSRLARLLWQLPGSRRLYLGVIRRTRPDHVRVREHDIELDALDSMMLSVNGAYEDLELDIFRHCISPGDTVVDVGAHIGLYTLEAARAVGTSGKVLAFEPATPNFQLLCSNVGRNGYTNVETFNAAVAAESGTAFLRHSSHNTGDHQLIDGDETAGSESVATVSLDEVLASRGIANVSVVKMDIQGAEPVALRGAIHLMSTSENLVLFTEVSPSHLQNWGGAAHYVRELGNCGFDFYRVDEAAQRLDAVSVAEINVAPRSNSREEHTNLVCVKGVEARNRLERVLSSASS